MTIEFTFIPNYIFSFVWESILEQKSMKWEVLTFVCRSVNFVETLRAVGCQQLGSGASLQGPPVVLFGRHETWSHSLHRLMGAWLILMFRLQTLWVWEAEEWERDCKWSQRHGGDENKLEGFSTKEASWKIQKHTNKIVKAMKNWLQRDKKQAQQDTKTSRDVGHKKQNSKVISEMWKKLWEDVKWSQTCT